MLAKTDRRVSRPSHPASAPAGRPFSASSSSPSPSGSHLQPFPERHPRPAAVAPAGQDSWASRLPCVVAAAATGEAGLGREGAGGSAARPLHSGRAKQTRSRQGTGRDSSQMRKSCFRLGPGFAAQGAEVTCWRSRRQGHPGPGREVLLLQQEPGTRPSTFRYQKTPPQIKLTFFRWEGPQTS